VVVLQVCIIANLRVSCTNETSYILIKYTQLHENAFHPIAGPCNLVHTLFSLLSVLLYFVSLLFLVIIYFKLSL
jgi:hypothetical protein